MDTTELESALKGRLGALVNYVGVFSSDSVGRMKIPLKRNNALIFIANTLEASSDINNMGHWVCFYIAKSPNNRIIFFDSYALSPEIYTHHFQLFLKRNSSFKFFEFKTPVQPDRSYKCGFYVLFFIHSMSHYGVRQTLQKIKKNMSGRELYKNDRWVLQYYFKFLGRRKCSEWRFGDKRAITYSECLKAGEK